MFYFPAVILVPVSQSRLAVPSHNQIKSLKTMYNLIRFLSLQLCIILFLCVFDIYLQSMLMIDRCDKEIKWDELNIDNAALI